QQDRGRHRLPHNALHGRGRPRGGPHRRNRPRPHRRARLVGRVEAADRDRLPRSGVPEAHGHHDPRRERHGRRRRAGVCAGLEAQPMTVIYILWLREVKKYLRSRVQIVASLGGPLMYLGVLGFGLGAVFQRAGEGNYIQFMAPGVIGMTVLFTAMFSGFAMLWDRQFGFLKETLVAPVPRLAIMVGRTLGGATVAVLQGALIFVIALIAGFRPT